MKPLANQPKLVQKHTNKSKTRHKKIKIQPKKHPKTKNSKSSSFSHLPLSLPRTSQQLRTLRTLRPAPQSGDGPAQLLHQRAAGLLTRGWRSFYWRKKQQKQYISKKTKNTHAKVFCFCLRKFFLWVCPQVFFFWQLDGWVKSFLTDCKRKVLHAIPKIGPSIRKHVSFCIGVPYL